MRHRPGRASWFWRRRDGLRLGSLVLLASLTGWWSVPVQAESIPQAVDRMDGTLTEMDRKIREMERRLRELGERVRELERATAERREAAGAVASEQGASSGLQPASGSPESVEASLGLARADYAVVQLGLASLGFAPGKADGLVGPKTRRALRRWQASNGFEATGYLTRPLMVVLAAEAEKAEQLATDRKAPGTVFQDCPECPEMVVLPAGGFWMGSPPGERSRNSNEGPVHRVEIGKSFAAGRYEVTFSEWDACRRGGGCSHHPAAGGWGRGSRPVINVSWDDAQRFLSWLSRRTGKRYRLLTESEWEYAARGGTRARYFWGDSIGRNRANCDGCGSRWDKRQTAPVGLFPPNAYELHDMHGNVREWVQDCWHQNYEGAPVDGRAWTAGDGGDCRNRVLRGGSWLSSPESVRSSVRIKGFIGSRFVYVGFRVARTLD